MFMNDVYKKDEIKEFAIQDLRRMGVKYRRKKSKPSVQEVKKTTKCFKIDLHLLPTQVVTLSDGQQLVIPVVIHELCSFILKRIETEGLFRKEGSKSRQNEIKLSLNAGCKIEDDYHVIDVAGILKMLLRELPEPLIPTIFHDYFLRCTILDQGKLDAILLLCLLLPQEHLNTLAYLLRFFNTVSKHSLHNKMTAMNLSIVMGPNIIPFHQDKASYTTQHKVKKTCELVQLLIENANKVGIIPEYIIDQVATTTPDELAVVDKKKKRRSGSLTRMFNGLKKMVGNKSEEMSPTIVTPDLLLTPSISRSVKKRKMERISLSNKKKKEVINKLPEQKILKMPYTPISTPICGNPNPKTDKRKNAHKDVATEKSNQVKEKKSQWYSKNKFLKQTKTEDEENVRSSRTSLGPRSIIERRWSAVSNAAAFRKNKKRNSYGGSQHNLLIDSSKPTNVKEELKIEESLDDDYVKISKVEYEHIKNRVSAIERRISMEIDNVQLQMESVKENKDIKRPDPVQGVQTAYEQTLVQMEALSPTTDQLARRLSRDLKIRRSSDHVVIRSPSARKIGNLKRRSRELERQNGKLSRNQSWHVGTGTAITIPRVSMQRDRAISVQTNPVVAQNNLKATPTMSTPNLSDRVLRSSLNKTGSTPSLNITGTTMFHSAFSNNSSDAWTSGDRFFSTVKTPSDGSSSNGRPSVAKLRSQNAGMVLAKAKLFDNLVDSDSSNLSNKSNKSNTKVKTTYKIGGVRHSEVKLCQRVKTLRMEDKKNKKTSSPRRNRLNLSQRQKRQAVKQLVEGHRCRSVFDHASDKENPFDRDLISPIKFTPLKSPVIRKPMLVKSPKRLCRTPQIDRSTPLKVFTPRPMDF